MREQHDYIIHNLLSHWLIKVRQIWMFIPAWWGMRWQWDWYQVPSMCLNKQREKKNHLDIGPRHAPVKLHPPGWPPLTSVGGHDDPQPVERISTVRRHDTKQRNLKYKAKNFWQVLLHEWTWSQLVTSIRLLGFGDNYVHTTIQREGQECTCMLIIKINISYKELFSFTTQTQETLKTDSIYYTHMYMYQLLYNMYMYMCVAESNLATDKKDEQSNGRP